MGVFGLRGHTLVTIEIIEIIEIICKHPIKYTL